MMPVLRIFYCVKFYLHFEDNLRPPFHQMSDFTSNPPPLLSWQQLCIAPLKFFSPALLIIIAQSLMQLHNPWGIKRQKKQNKS